MASVALEQGEYAEAQAYFEQALRSYRQVGDRYNEGAALGKLGDVAFQQGDYQAARIYYEQALEPVSERSARGWARAQCWRIWGWSCIIWAITRRREP